MTRVLLVLLFSVLLSSCAVTRVYNLDNYNVPGNDDLGNPSVKKKWVEFDTLFTEYYLPIDWETNRYISKKHLVILRSSKENQKKFRFFFKQFWEKEIEPETENESRE